MSASCTTTRPAVGGAPVYSPGSVIEPEPAPIRPGTALRSCDPPSGREPAGGRQGPSEDIAEPWPHVLHCERGLATGVPAGGRADDTPGDAHFQDASRRDRDVQGPVARRIAKRRRERQDCSLGTPDGERVTGSGSLSRPSRTAMRALS